MQEGHKLQFSCEACETPILFSVLENNQPNQLLICPHCDRKYCFDDETLLRHLRQFEALCRQIHASKEILGSTSIAIDVSTHHVKVPFNILLTRLPSVIKLDINGHELPPIFFQVDTLKDVPHALV